MEALGLLQVCHTYSIEVRHRHRHHKDPTKRRRSHRCSSMLMLPDRTLGPISIVFRRSSCIPRPSAASWVCIKFDYCERGMNGGSGGCGEVITAPGGVITVLGRVITWFGISVVFRNSVHYRIAVPRYRSLLNRVLGKNLSGGGVRAPRLAGGGLLYSRGDSRLGGKPSSVVWLEREQATTKSRGPGENHTSPIIFNFSNYANF